MNRILCMIAAAVLLSAPAGADCVPGAVWCSGNYAYDASGNIRSIGADTYAYDSAGRLVSGTADYQRSGILSRQTYGYDAYGNRVAAARDAGSTGCDVTCEMTLAVDSASNHLSGSGIAYDDAGNLVSIQDSVNGNTYVATYTYDALNMMRHAVTTNDDRQFLYTADDERLATREGYSWTWTIRGMDGKILRSFTSLENYGVPTWAFTWRKDYVYRDGALLASTTSGDSSALHFHLDHLGTPRVVTNDSGVLVGVHAYYAFGSELQLSPTESSTELLKFTGHERDLLAGEPNMVDDMHARYYMANLGRFLSVDPTWDSGDVGRPQAWNRYSYVVNNPVGHTDPNGRCTDVLTCSVEGFALGNVPGALVGAGLGLALGYGLTHPHVVVTVGSSMGGGSGGENFAERWIRQNNSNHMAENHAQETKKDPKRRFSKGDREAALDKSKDANGTPRCEYCGSELDPKPGNGNSYEADHRNPHAQGGQTDQDNLAPSCRDCNREKGNRTPEQWKKDKEKERQ